MAIVIDAEQTSTIQLSSRLVVFSPTPPSRHRLVVVCLGKSISCLSLAATGIKTFHYCWRSRTRCRACSSAHALLGKTNAKSEKKRSTLSIFFSLLFSWSGRWQTHSVPAGTARKERRTERERENGSEHSLIFCEMWSEFVPLLLLSLLATAIAVFSSKTFLPQPTRSSRNRSKWNGDFLSHVHLHWTDLCYLIITCCLRRHQYYSRDHFPESRTGLDGS